MFFDTGQQSGVEVYCSLACLCNTLRQEAYRSAAIIRSRPPPRSIRPSTRPLVTHVICAAVDAAASATANTAASVTHAAVTNAHATNAVSHQSS